jgi:hypothetical protein
MTATRGFSFSTTVRVVNWVHNDPANLGPTSQPASASGFPQNHISMFDVTNLPQRRHALDGNFSDFT